MRVLLMLVVASFCVPAQDKPISIEAESGKVVKVGKLDWVKVVKPDGFSGTGAMMATPNDNVLNDEDYLTTSPRLDFEVDFPKAGTYIVWVRGMGDVEDNSCHIGLDGKAVASADKIAEFETDWTWCKDTKDSEDATLKIDAAGKRTLNVWMREDGFIIDRILLTTDKSFTPTGKGP